MENYEMILKESLISKGAASVGFADLSGVPEHYRKGYKYGISILAAFSPEVIAESGNRLSEACYREYKKVCDILDDLARYTARFLEVADYLAYPVLSNGVHINEKRRKTYLSQKTAAYMSGLGWIGKNSLLITKEYGAAVKMVTVLTNAQLDVGAPMEKSKCGTCTKCKEVFQSGMGEGEHWDIQEGLHDHLSGCESALICPWTQKYINQSQRQIRQCV